MFCKTHPGKIEGMASWLILGGVIPLAVALVAQFAFHLPPCHFCLAQRYPYVLVILCGGLSLRVPRAGERWRLCVAFGFYGLLATGLLGLTHTAIEQGWLQFGGGCVAQAPADGSLEALRAAIHAAPLVSCDTPLAHFLGLSMAAWNVIWAVGVGLLVAAQYRYDTARHAC